MAAKSATSYWLYKYVIISKCSAKLLLFEFLGQQNNSGFMH